MMQLPGGEKILMNSDDLAVSSLSTSQSDQHTDSVLWCSGQTQEILMVPLLEVQVETCITLTGRMSFSKNDVVDQS